MLTFCHRSSDFFTQILGLAIAGLSKRFRVVGSRSKTQLLFTKNVLCTDFVITSLSTPMGVDDVVIGFDMEVQPYATHKTA